MKKALVERQYLDLKNLSTFSDISVDALRGYLEDADRPLPHFRLKGKIIVRIREFEEWLQGYRAKSEDQAKAIKKLVSVR
ncbi:MAG: hypothetical protein ACYTEL_00510 [Planctomycetota bacterium]|jgi:hypothetical protein